MDIFSLVPREARLQAAIRELEHCNTYTACYGLALSPVQMAELAQHRLLALEKTGRVEFGTGILGKLVEAFCTSPYLMQENYEATLLELQDMFYYFKGQSRERLSDSKLITAMKEAFDGPAQGSLEYVSGTVLEELCRALQGQADKDDNNNENKEAADDEY